MPPVKDSHCSFCGAAYEPPLRYPRRCPRCQAEVWANPIPVCVVLVPVITGSRTGLLVVRRDIEPARGKLALVGGFLEAHETWAEGGAREVREETGVEIDPASLQPLWFSSTSPRPDRVLLFSVAAAVDADAFAPHVPNVEAAERGVVFGPSGLEAVFAFPLHVEAARRYFTDRGERGDHGYRPV